MDGQDYLNQISADNRPVKTSTFKKIISSKFFLIGIIALVAFIIIMIIGGILSGNKTDIKTLSFSLKAHLDNTSEIINEYQSNLKSSNLRSINASLYSVLSNTNNELTNYLDEKYGAKSNNANKNTADQLTLEKDAIINELFEAKINGNLDRIYTHKMTYEISKIMSEETKILNSTNDDTLKNLLAKSYDSLSNVYNSFNNFSETK